MVFQHLQSFGCCSSACCDACRHPRARHTQEHSKHADTSKLRTEVMAAKTSMGVKRSAMPASLHQTHIPIICALAYTIAY